MSVPLQGTPREVYLKVCGDVEMLLRFLRADLDTHAARASLDQSSVALVDELGAVRSRLISIVAMLQRLPESTIDMMVRQAGQVNAPKDIA